MKTLILALLISSQAIAQKNLTMDQFYPIDAGHSYIEFAVKYMGYAKVKGRFGEFSGMFRYDAKDAENISVTLVIKTESIDTDLEFRDNDLKSENWLDAKKFPSIKFTSKKTSKKGEGFDVTGDLSIRDVTKEVVLHLDQPSGVVKDVRGDAMVIFTGRISINRTDYGVEGKKWSAVKEGITAVENEVTIEFSILGKQLKAGNFSNWVSDEARPQGKLYKIAKEKGVDACLSEFQKMKNENTANENTLIIASKMILLEGNTDAAIKLREANQQAFPTSSTVSFSLCEAYATKGDWTKAKENFAKAKELDPANTQALEVLKNLN